MASYPRVERLESVTVVIPVINETRALEQTARSVAGGAGPRLRELLIVVGERTTSEALAVAEKLSREMKGLAVVLRQKRPFLGGAFQDAFEAARGSHILMMASDLETDPSLVPALLAEAEKQPSAIIAASRWLGGARFHGYSRVKLACNWAFQGFFARLYGAPLTDMTYAYRILPAALARAIRWEEPRHPFLLETLVKPLRLGVPVVEVPATWRARTEGESQNSFLRNFGYVRVGLSARWRPAASLLA